MRLRITFSKDGPLTFTSHLDLMRAWERALRRAGVSLAYSGGFNPRPRIQIALALPLGHTGEGELVDVRMERPQPLEEFTRSVAPVLPAGLGIRRVVRVDPKGPALATKVVAADYIVTTERDMTTPDLGAQIDRLMAKTSLFVEWRGRHPDIRPLIERLWLVEGSDSKGVLGMQLAAREGATARPEAVLQALAIGHLFARYHRRRILLAVG